MTSEESCLETKEIDYQLKYDTISTTMTFADLKKLRSYVDSDYRLFSGRKFAQMLGKNGEMVWIWLSHDANKITGISEFGDFLIERKIWKRSWYN